MARRQIFTADEYRKFVQQLRSEFKERKISVTAAAEVLGITRQSLHMHLAGHHQPRWRIVGRAIRAWDMTVYARGQKFDKRGFAAEKTVQDASVQLLLLPEAIENLGNADLEVKVVRKEASR